MTVDYDPRRPETIADPFPIFARLRERDPVHWSERLGGWVLTRYRDVRMVLADRRFSADRISPYRDHLPPTQRTALQELMTTLGFWAVFNDPPDHTRRRALLSGLFSAGRIAALRPMIERVVEPLLARLAERSRFDLIADFAYPLPAIVIARIVGVPAEDIDQFKTWSDDLAAFVGSALATPDKRERAERGARDLAAYFRRMLHDHRARPREDALSALLAAEVDGERLSEEEIVASAMLLLFAGHETTTNLIGNGVLALLRHPDQMALLRARPELTPSAVEEMLRFDGPTQAMTRIAREEIAFSDTRGATRAVPAGARIFALLNAANRDPEIFPEPDRFLVERGSTRHLSFGIGTHFCLGAPLARLEAEIGIAALVRRFPDLVLADELLQWSDSLVLRGVRSLPLCRAAGG
jgi:cytochrome P450